MMICTVHVQQIFQLNGAEYGHVRNLLSKFYLFAVISKIIIKVYNQTLTQLVFSLFICIICTDVRHFKLWSSAMVSAMITPVSRCLHHTVASVEHVCIVDMDSLDK